MSRCSNRERLSIAIYLPAIADGAWTPVEIGVMNVPLNEQSKRKYALFVLAIFFLMLAGAGLVIGSNNVAIRSLAMLAVIISVYCVRVANIHVGIDSAATASQQSRSKLPARPRRSLWIVCIILLPLFGLSFIWLYSDAVQGYHQIWPVYCFAGIAIACALCWSYLVASLLYAR
jgi:hypothetical protein